MEVARRGISNLNSSDDTRFRRFRVKIQMEELALLLSIDKADRQLKRLNNDGYSSEKGAGIADEHEAWAVRTNFFRKRLKLVRQSLDRMSSGEYGICAACHRKIRAKRLNAVPTAIYCLECQQLFERRSAGADLSL